MNQLTKTNKLDLIPLGLRSFASARVGIPPYKNLSDRDKTSSCYDLITKVHASHGHQGNDPKVLAFQTQELKDCLKDKYGELTVLEIQIAFEMLIAGEFGAYMGLYKKSYYQALKGYYEKPQRAESMKQYLAIVETESKAELSPDEKLRRNKEACVWCFEEYKKTGNIPNGHYKFYQTLLDLGLIKWTKEEKKAISTPIKSQYEKELETSKKRGHISTSQLAELLITLDSNPTLISRVRKVALAKYFDNLIKEGIELKTIIK